MDDNRTGTGAYCAEGTAVRAADINVPNIMCNINNEDMLSWIEEHVEPKEHHIGGHVYMKQGMARVDKKEYPSTMEFRTLDGFLDYIRSGCDRMEDMHYFLRIISPVEVLLESELDEEQRRYRLAASKADVPKGIITEAGRTQTQFSTEEFIIGLRTCFQSHAAKSPEEAGQLCVADRDRDLLLNIASNLCDESSVKYTDDGMAQQVQVNAGVGTVADAVMPDIVSLSPYRTFKEIDQPISDFIFRVQKSNGELCLSLIGADGGAWRDEVTAELADYCREELKDCEHCDNVTVLR